MRTPSTTFLLLLVLALLFATTSVSAGDFLSDKNCPTGSVFVWTGIKADPGKQCGDPWSQAYACINEGKPVKKGRYAFPGRNEELCTPKPPLRYTLLSTQGNSTVAAGTKDVMVASVQLIADAANAEPVLVRGVSGIFEGDATAIAACALLADGVVLMDGFALTAGTATMPFRTPVEVSPGVSVSLTVTCTIHSDAAGKTYRWGLVEHQDAVRMGQDVFPPEIAIARRPDGRAGSNGVTMTVVPNSITLDHVTYHDILLPPQGSTVAPGTALTAQLEVTNDGGVPWEAGAYELHPRTEVTKAWMAGGRTAIPLPERTLPGASATFPLSLVAPAATVPSSYELSWYLVRLADGRQLIQPSTFPELALMVNPVSPKPTLLETLISTFAPPVAITPSGPVPTDTGSDLVVLPAPGDTDGAMPTGTTVVGTSPTTDPEESTPPLTPADPLSETIPGSVSPAVNLSTNTVTPSPGLPQVPVTTLPPVQPTTPTPRPAPTPSLPLPSIQGVLDPIAAAKAILQEILSLVDPKEVDYPKLKIEANALAAQFSALSLEDKNHALPKVPTILTFPGGSFVMSFAENSFPVDMRMTVDVKTPEEISILLATKPLPAGYGVLGQVLLGEFHVTPSDPTVKTLLTHPVQVTLDFEDETLTGWDWDKETIGVYRLSENGTWKKISGNAVVVYSKNKITVTAQPNIDELGVMALVGKKLPPPPPPPAPIQGSALIFAHPLASLVCSVFELFGWPRPLTCN